MKSATDRSRRRAAGEASESFTETVRKASTLGKLGDAAEVARFVVHLSAMRHVSGQVLALDSRILPWG